MKEILLDSVGIFFQILNILVFIRVILSWVGHDERYSKRTKLLYEITDPILEPCRKLLNRWQSGIMIDFSPFVALIFLEILNQALKYIIVSFL